MPRTCYVPKRFSEQSKATIEVANRIIADYAAQGFILTLRQLYYQFVSRGLIENKQTEYKRLGSILNDARLAGLIDWESMEDRTRNVRANSHWSKPLNILESARDSFATDKWKTQPYYPEVWIEKDALVGVIEPVCRRLDVPYFSCRGYTSQSEQWRAGQRLNAARRRGQTPIIFHLGDHDPSGIDMTGDNWRRLSLFAGYPWEDVRNVYDKGEAFTQALFDARERAEGTPIVKRLALNFSQVEEHSPPPNPAKFTDSRCETYVESFGRESWELDALDPSTLAGLIEDAVLEIRNDTLWNEAVAEQEDGRAIIADFITQLSG